MTEPAVEVASLSVSYRVRHEQAATLREYLGSAVGGAARQQTFWALRDVSFTVPRGEVLGVVGANGAGKSTLMKTLARVVLPAAGHVVVRGRLAPLIELGAGFNPDLTGWEDAEGMQRFRLLSVEPCRALFSGLTIRCDGDGRLLIAVRMRARDGSISELVFRFTRAG